MSDVFVVEVKPPVATVLLNRPDKGNRLMTPEVRELGQQIRALGNRPDIKVVVLRGAGENFCLGRDPGPPGSGPKSALAMRSGIADPILDLYADIRASTAPILAVVQGQAKGFGCATAGICDLTIAADNARFSLPEMDGNLPPTLAISALLGKVPPKRLLHMVYTRGEIDAADALAMGLISEVVPRARLDDAVAATLAKLTDRRRPALSALKEYMNIAPHIDIAAQARFGASLMSVVLSSPDE
jgi:enoyl-CoA hydratase